MKSPKTINGVSVLRVNMRVRGAIPRLRDGLTLARLRAPRGEKSSLQLDDCLNTAISKMSATQTIEDVRQ